MGGKKDEGHEVFGKKAMDPVVDQAKNVESVERSAVVRLRDKLEPDATCLKVPELPD